jgi:glycosyltransferase involved in cell wall biosynthesis
MTTARVLMTADAVGGVWTYALELARALADYDVRTTLVTIGPRPDRNQATAAAAIRGLELIPTSFTLEWTPDGWRDFDASAEWLLALERRLHPTVVHLNGYSHAALGWTAPTLVVGHSCVVSWRDAVGGDIDAHWLDEYRARVADGLHRATWVVAPSAAMRNELRRCYGPVANISVIPNGRDPARFRPGAKAPLVFTAGRLWDRAKNIDAVRGIAPHLSWPVLIAGDVTVGCGRCAEREMIAHLGRASIAVLPARYEPFGLLALEAALSGCALVLGDIPSQREIWADTATFVDPDDPEALHAAIEALIACPEQRQRAAWRARRRAMRFTPAEMARRYMWIYRRISGGGDADPWRLACAS